MPGRLVNSKLLIKQYSRWTEVYRAVETPKGVGFGPLLRTFEGRFHGLRAEAWVAWWLLVRSWGQG